MSASLELPNMEDSIARLLPGNEAHDRARLLAELAAYADTAVREARRRGTVVPDSTTLQHARPWLVRPVFVCGHHRSGTTLLQELLDGHPELTVLPSEGTYFSSFRYVARRDRTAHELDRFCADWIARLIDPNFAPHFRLGRSTRDSQPYVDLARALAGWHDALRAETPREFAPLLALVAACHEALSPHSTPRRWVEKTPLNERFARRLFRFPDARVIQLVRDPRTTFVSLRELYRTRSEPRFDAVAHARAIARSLRIARTNQRRFANRYLVVRYEDLANEPVGVMERIRAFLGIAPSGTLQVATAGGSLVSPNTSFEAGAPGAVRKIREGPALLAEEAQVLRACAASAGRLWGYELGSPSWHDRFNAWRLRIRPP
jgi:hypothetical protein